MKLNILPNAHINSKSMELKITLKWSLPQSSKHGRTHALIHEPAHAYYNF